MTHLLLLLALMAPAHKDTWYVPPKCIREVNWGPKPCTQLTSTTMVCDKVVFTIQCVSVSRADPGKMDMIIPVPADLQHLKDLQELMEALKPDGKVR